MVCIEGERDEEKRNEGRVEEESESKKLKEGVRYRANEKEKKR